MPVKKRTAKRRLDPAAELEAWSMVFQGGHDYFGDLPKIGVPMDEPGYRPDQGAAEEAWRRLGARFLAEKADPVLSWARPGPCASSESPMPVKQRRGKARAFDDFHRQQLLEGPDAVLLAGVGYLWSVQEPTFDRATPEEQAFVLAEMREDWARYGREMMVRWCAGEREPTARPWVFPARGGPDRLPWAAQEFGEP